jgi:hypothetical protein
MGMPADAKIHLEEVDWTDVMDLALAKVAGMTAVDVGSRYGIEADVVTRWRRRRSTGVQIRSVVRKYREVLLEMAEGRDPAGAIPMGNHKVVRRVLYTDWTAMVDQALQKLEGLDASAAARRSGISAEMILNWRRRRRQNEPIQNVHRHKRGALERFVELDDTPARIPLTK